MRKGETRSRTHELIYGIVSGFLGSGLISYYLLNYSEVTLPISLVFGIFTPLIAAFVILAMITVNKNKREKYVNKYWEEPKKEMSEKRKRLKPSYEVR